MASYRITFAVDPFCMQVLTPLDGTISGMKYGRATAQQQPVSQITLPMFDVAHGVALASMPIFKRHPTAPTTTSVLRSYERHLVQTGMPEAMTLDDTKIDSVVGSHSNSYHRGSTQQVHYPEDGLVHYYVTGNLDDILDIIRRHPAIGAWTGRGFGVIRPGRNGSIAKVSTVNEPLCGIFATIDGVRRLVRPIPIDLAKTLNVERDQYFETDGRSAVPYNPQVMREYGYQSQAIAMPTFGILHA